MADNEENFAYKPFSGLGGVFSAKAEDKAKNALDPADQEMFARAMRDLGRPGGQKISGFTLAEQCVMPTIKKPKPDAKKTKPAPAPKPAENPEDLFAIAMRNTRPLGGKGRKVPAPKPAIRQRTDAEMTQADYMAANVEFAVSNSDEYLEGSAVGLDPLIMNRLREGQFSPEAHLDLHGLNADDAFGNLTEFLRQCWFKGLRAALVVTGRGRNSPGGMSILRQKLPYWLTHEPFKRVVLAFCTAKPHDGGPGSIYVLLRKARKKGPARWETLAYTSEDF